MDFFDFIKEHKLIILLISIIANVLLLGASGILFYQKINYNCPSPDIIAAVQEETPEVVSCPEPIEPEKFYVEIKGAVNTPGVYEVTEENIINDIVNMAGGFSKNAYTNNINLSRKVTKELVIYVYTNNEFTKKNTQIVVQNVCPTIDYDITECIENKQSEIVTNESINSSENENNQSNMDNNTTENVTESVSQLININSASITELQTLSGIGESKAQKIIEYRTQNGNFKSIEEIKNVSGIGDTIYEKIKDYITV